ncbi:MAG: multicopper oxidase domain-containing protein [Gemmatimonadales bacterium]
MASPRFGHVAIVMFGATALGWSAPLPAPSRVVANDNRVPAGTLVGDTLRIDLVLQQAEWYPEAEDGPHVTVEAFGEAGKIPSIPAPLIRVRERTVIHATVRNLLTDSTAHVIGLGTHPIADGDTLHIRPGDSALVTFVAGAPGTYLYRANIGLQGAALADPHRTTTGGAFVVDPVGGSPPDRILVMNIISYEVDSTHVKEAFAINGKSWPYTERLSMTVGDSLRWRVINGTVRGHPMHLHGFYFRTTAIGTGLASKSMSQGQQSLAVTDSYAPWSTREFTWSPDRPGNWLFHCHLSFHVIPDVRLDKDPADEHQTHSPDPMVHMAGLVMGITVSPRPEAAAPKLPPARRLDLWFQQGGKRGSMPATYSYILQRGRTPPAPDSVEIPGTPLILTRDVPVDIVVHNRTTQPGGVHWHGIELLSWSDGVVGWSSQDTAMAPAILPGGTFTAKLLLPRAGTFIYHTHMNDIEQATGGAVGAIVVLEPGQRFDRTRDHLYLTHWNGPEGYPLVNGDSATSRPLQLAGGVTQRFRFINIGPAGRFRFVLRHDTTVVTWRARAKDGADLPPALRTKRAANVVIDVGETFDFEFTTPKRSGAYELSLTTVNGKFTPWRQRLTVP